MWPWQVKVNIINTWCILISEAVTVPSLTMVTSTVSEESLARDTRTHARMHACTHTHKHSLGSLCYSLLCKQKSTTSWNNFHMLKQMQHTQTQHAETNSIGLPGGRVVTCASCAVIKGHGYDSHKHNLFFCLIFCLSPYHTHIFLQKQRNLSEKIKK